MKERAHRALEKARLSVRFNRKWLAAEFEAVRRETYDSVLLGLRSEEQTVQVRAIIASVEADQALASEGTP